jgi:hypothetical protein
MTTSKIMKMLCKNLSSQELLDLYLAMDEDGPAGPLYCALNDHVAMLFPEQFVDMSDPNKFEFEIEEIQS